MRDEICNETYEKIKSLLGDKFSDMMGVYLQNTQEYLDAMRVGLDANDTEAVCHSAHTLKSSSATLGFLGLSYISSDIERMSKEGGGSQNCAVLLEEASRVFEVVKEKVAG